MIKIVVDSGCDYRKEMKDTHGINLEVAPLHLRLLEKLFVDDDDLDVDNFVKEMSACPDISRTSAPSPETYLQKFKGEETVFAITLSSKLSASYSSAMTAKQMYFDEIGTKCIHVFDSLSASIGEALIALKIIECQKENKSNTEIITHVTSFIENMKTYFILEKYDAAVKSGRMKPYVAKIASLMSFIPICFADKGKMEVLDKARGLNRAIEKVVNLIQKDTADFENKILAISHCKCLDKAIAYKEAILAKVKFKDVIICETGGLCASYADTGGIIIVY